MEFFALFSKMAVSVAVVVAMCVGCALVVLGAVNDEHEVWKIPVVIILGAAIIFGLWS